MRQTLLTLFICLPWILSAQPYNIKQLGVREGLSSNYVVSIAQDKRGFLWFATEEGLNTFDGTQFRPYYKGESTEKQGITGNELNCILDDPSDSILWIATQRAGLNAYDYAKNRFTVYRHKEGAPDSLITDDITKIVPASDGNLWICTYWKGIDYFDKRARRFVHFNKETVPELASDHIWCAVDNGNGRLYIGHVHDGFSILSVKEKTCKNFRHAPNDIHTLPSDEVTCIYKDKGGNVWVGTGKGLALFNPETEKFVRFNDKNGSLSYRICDIRQMNDNKLWIAMEFGGIAILDPSQHLYYPSEEMHLSFIRERDNNQGLSNPSVRCLFQDSFSNVWVGSWGGGINFVRNTPMLFNVYKYSHLLSDDYNLNCKIALGVCMDHDGKLWIGTDGGGINVFDGEKRIAVYDTSNSCLNGNTVQTAMCDSKGGLWFGNFFGGIVHYDTHTRKFQPVNLNDDKTIDVRSFYEDGDGNIWIGTSKGIYVVDRETRKCKAHYDRENNLVRYVLKDSEGQVWVGFFGGGLGLYDSEVNLIRLFNVMGNFPSNTVNHIYEDSRKRLWVATGEGLVCFPTLTDTVYQVYRRESGLANTHIQAIGEDKAGNIWMSTNRGISCLVDNNTPFYNYDNQDDLPIGSFNRGSIAYGKDGKFYFGSIDGMCYFNPEYVLRKRESPLAFITGIEIADPVSKSVSKQTIIELNNRRNIRLEYTQNSFNVRFNVLNYALINQVEYAYMLKGFENEWYPVSTANKVTFRNLPPGKYQFLIKTRMRNQEWSNDVQSIYIRIAPPIWLTWWAKMCYALAIVLVLCGLIYIYKKRLDAESLYKLEKQSHEHEQDLNNERLRFYTNITHELRTPLTLILGPLEDIQKDNSLSTKDAQKISVIHQSALRLLNLINQILEFRKTETQNRKLSVRRANIVPVIYETGLKYKELNRKPEVNIQITVEKEYIPLYFDREVVQIILDNLISNALKYTEEGTISVSIGQSRQADVDYAELRVSDTGYGIEPDALPHIFERYYQEGGKHQASGTGIGLSLVKNLVALHEGEIQVESIPNAGSTFCVRLLMDNSYPNALHTDAEEPAFAEAAHAENDSANNDKPILLIIEDDPDISDYIAESFVNSFDVKVAANGMQGRDSAFKYIPDIIVSDIMMPVMDGIELCRELKKDIRTSHIPIILLTAKDSLKDREEGYSTGADSYISKPFSASLLHSRIENLLQLRRNLANHFSASTTVSEEPAETADSLSKMDDEFIQKINDLIKEGMSSEKMGIAYLADKMCMSNSTLYRKMKALTGLSTNEYIRKIRMQFAQQFLLEGKYNVSEIAFKVGISNQFYFRQCFKEEFGDTPSGYLKKMKGN